MKYEYEIKKTRIIVDRYTITSTDKLSIDEIEENVREEFVYVGQSNKFTLDHMTTETTYVGQDDVQSKETIDTVQIIKFCFNTKNPFFIYCVIKK